MLSSSGGGGIGGGFGPTFQLYTSNYTAFMQAALTNDPVTLVTLFPGLVINSYSYYYVNGLPHYVYDFANVIVITNDYHTNTSGALVTVQMTPPFVFSNTPTITTNTVPITLTNGEYNTVWPSGDYYIDTNTCGPTVIISPQPTGYPMATVVVMTNLLAAGTNSQGSYTESLVTSSTNHTFIAQAPICAVAPTNTTTTNTATPGLYPGIGKIRFVRADYDSLMGRHFSPITNTYTMIYTIGSQSVIQTFQRVVTAPDILFSAKDEASPIPPNSHPNFGPGGLDRSPPAYNQANILAGLAGPGTIDPVPTATITLDKVGDVYENGSLTENGLATNQFLSEFTQTQLSLLDWGSFDGTTNAPVVYPNGTSIQNLQNQVLIQISPTTLPPGTNNQPYTVTTFTASGGAFTPPYTWSATGLPSGLSVTNNYTLDPNGGGVLSGTPTQSGTFDFTLKLTDYNARSAQWTFPITIQ